MLGGVPTPQRLHHMLGGGGGGGLPGSDVRLLYLKSFRSHASSR